MKIRIKVTALVHRRPRAFSMDGNETGHISQAMPGEAPWLRSQPGERRSGSWCFAGLRRQEGAGPYAQSVRRLRTASSGTGKGGPIPTREGSVPRNRLAPGPDGSVGRRDGLVATITVLRSLLLFGAAWGLGLWMNPGSIGELLRRGLWFNAILAGPGVLAGFRLAPSVESDGWVNPVMIIGNTGEKKCGFPLSTV